MNNSLGSQTVKNFVNFRVIKENPKTELIEVEMSFPIFRLEKIDLIELTNKHLKNLLEVYSDDRVTEFMDIHSMKTLEEVNKEWVQWADKQFNDSTGIRWGILLEEKMVGTCGFHNIHIKDKKKIAEIGYDLKYEYWGKGLFYEILPIIIKFAFSELHIDEIHALIFPENIRNYSANFYKIIKKNH